jgi:hypothetical protein
MIGSLSFCLLLLLSYGATLRHWLSTLPLPIHLPQPLLGVRVSIGETPCLPSEPESRQRQSPKSRQHIAYIRQLL